MKDKFKVVLLGSDDNVYGISRSFYDSYGVTSIAYGYGHLVPTRYSNIVNVNVIENFNDESVCIKTLIDEGKKLKEKYKHLILVPCSDSYMEFCIKNKDKLESIYDNKFIDEDLLKSFVTKDKFYSLCDKYNLKYPKTMIVSYKDRKDIHKKIKFKYPIVLKPNNSNSNEYLYCDFPEKKKVFIIKDEKELIKVIDNINLSTYKDNLIIQEFIHGDDTCNRVINCYSDRFGKVRMMAMGRPILEEYAPSTMGNYASIISEPGYNKIFDVIKNLLESIGYVGFSNFDLKYDEKTKEYYIFEINYRQGRSSFYVNASGISLSKLLVDDYIYHIDSNEIIYPTKKILWVNIPEDILLKYVKNKKVLLEIDDLIKENREVQTLFYDKDCSFLRYEKMIKFFEVKRTQFEKYFIEKQVE